MANDGKYLEQLVDEFFNGLMDTEIVHTRLTDSKAARNVIKANNADFLCSTIKQGAFHLECKSLANKHLRLTKFAQYPLMHRWDMAGTPGFVLAHFYNLEVFVVVNIAALAPLDKSWSVKGFPKFKSFEGAMRWLIS